MKNKRNFKKVIATSIIILFFITSIFSMVGISKIEDFNIKFSDSYEYYSYQKMKDFFIDLRDNNSEIMSLESIGNTYEGRDVLMVKLSDNVDEKEDEPGVLLLGAHHGNEKPSYEVLIFFIKHMVENYWKENTDDDEDGLINEDIIDGLDNDEDGLIDEDPSEDRVRDILNSTQIFLIPMVNPDGVEANSRKNRAPNYGPFGNRNVITSYGVNLNRNYDDKWFLYYIFPFNYNLILNLIDSSFNYRGEHPFSENETKAVRDFVIDQNISISLSYHSYSEVILYPWMHTSIPTPDEDLFISIGENMSSINGYYLYTGRNYLIPRFAGTLGSSENWLYRERGIISYTMELCREYAPSNPQIVFDTCFKNLGVDLYVCERAQII